MNYYSFDTTLHKASKNVFVLKLFQVAKKESLIEAEICTGPMRHNEGKFFLTGRFDKNNKTGQPHRKKEMFGRSFIKRIKLC